MFIDKFGQLVLNQNDLCDFYRSNSKNHIKYALITDQVNNTLDLDNFPNLIKYIEPSISLEEFDKNNQLNYNMPEYYKTMDIALFVLNSCKNEEELQRAGQELLLFQERGMFPLLQYLKYLVDLMKQHNITYGVGRGSSVASFVLYLIGVHRINSLYYDLPINEFIK